MMSTNTTLPPLPTPGYMANCDWIQSHFGELLRDHPDQWIAVDQDHVLAAGRAFSQVRDEAKQAGATPDVTHYFVASEFMVL